MTRIDFVVSVEADAAAVVAVEVEQPNGWEEMFDALRRTERTSVSLHQKLFKGTTQ